VAFFKKKNNDSLRQVKSTFLGGLFSAKALDDKLFEELEETLIMADVGAATAFTISDKCREIAKREKYKTADELKDAFKQICVEILGEDEELDLSKPPAIVLVVGVNGVGKTTSIGKLANLLQKNGKKVLLAAADTFRAAATEQLCFLAEKVGVDVIKTNEGGDPASVIYDAIDAINSRNIDVLICDTAGRLHTKKNLMEELAKINRIIDKKLPNSSVEVLLVLDGTTGQNGIMQAKEFAQSANLTGIILTKLDGSAKGGMVLAIKSELGVPVKFIGLGEKIEDIEMFNAVNFVDSLFGE